VHTVPCKVTGKCASVAVKLTPAPRGTGIVAAPISKKVLQFAGIDDVYTASSGHTKTAQNFITATFIALSKTYQYLSPDLWTKTELLQAPDAKHAKWLSENSKPSTAAKLRGDRPRGRGGRGGGRGGRGGRGGGRGGPRRGSE
jgi:small subunit ribosomal protein S2e